MSGPLHAIRVPLLGGRIAFLPPREDAAITASMLFATRLYALHRDRHGHVANDRSAEFVPGLGYDLGSGLVTNIGVMAMANEAVTLASPSGARINVLFLANQHATGTGATAAAATDFKLQTISTQGGQTPVAGTQTIATTSTGAVPIYQTAATVTYTGSEAVTEWGLHTSGTLSSTTGTPFTAATATTFTATGTPFTASSATVQGLQQQIVIPGTTTVYGVIASNTTSVATLVNNGTTGWWTQAAGAAGSTPGGSESYTLRPILWDHKVFSAINVVNTDTITFSYRLQVNSGG